MSIDRLTTLLARFQPKAHVFLAGTLSEPHTKQANRAVGHIYWLFDGKIDLSVDGQPIDALDQPSVVFLPKPIAHSLSPKPTAQVLCCEVEFGQRASNPLALLQSDVIIFKMSEADEFKAIGELIHQELSMNRCGQPFGLAQLMQYFVLVLLRHLISANRLPMGITRALADPRLLRAVTAMHDFPSRHWRVEHLAFEAGMSRAVFFNHFKQATGQTPLDYLTDWRMSVSQSMLLTGHPIKQIAHAVGYSGSAALIRVFHRKVGCSPAQWANTQRLNDQQRVNLLR